jgi:hypothetical protein
MKFSFLAWENVSNIPFPDEIKEITKDLKWDDQDWQVQGLPIPFAHYTLADGKTLYLQELPDGRVRVEKQDFTGDITVGSYFQNKDTTGDNFFLALGVTLYKGEVKDICVREVMRHPAQKMQEISEHIKSMLHRQVERQKQWWFRWLYKPYAIVTRILFNIALVGILGCIFVLNLLKILLSKVMHWLTPL